MEYDSNVCNSYCKNLMNELIFCRKSFELNITFNISHIKNMRSLSSVSSVSFVSDVGVLFSPFPDPLVYFTYPVQIQKYVPSLEFKDFKSVINTADANFKSLYPIAYENLKINYSNHLLFFPYALSKDREDSKELKLFHDIGFIQYLLNYANLNDLDHLNLNFTDQKEIKIIKESLSAPPVAGASVGGVTTAPILRAHLGSPHLFYRWLWKRNQIQNSNLRYQIVNRKPFYNFSNRVQFHRDNMFPLENYLNTMLTFTSPSGAVGIGAAPTLSDKYGLYCGDDQKEWESSYLRGYNGSYENCAQLFSQQLNFLNSPQYQYQYRYPYPSPSLAPSGAVAILSEEERKAIENLEPIPSIDYETRMIKKRKQFYQSKLDEAKKEYKDAEKELFLLKTVPFLRSSRNI